MMQFVILDEIVDVSGFDAKEKNIVTKPIYVKVSSINAFKETSYGGVPATQVMMQNDCILVTETPVAIMERCHGYVSEDFAA